MAFIIQIHHIPVPNIDSIVPLYYVDSENMTGYTTSMHGVCLTFIRKNIDKNNLSDDIRKKDHCVKNVDKIYEKSKDGYYYTADENNNIFVMYKKTLCTGYIYNSIIVEKIFSLKCTKGNRICPKVFEKSTDKYIDFVSELKNRTSDYRNRNNNIESIDHLIKNSYKQEMTKITINHINLNNLNNCS